MGKSTNFPLKTHGFPAQLHGGEIPLRSSTDPQSPRSPGRPAVFCLGVDLHWGNLQKAIEHGHRHS